MCHTVSCLYDSVGLSIAPTSTQTTDYQQRGRSELAGAPADGSSTPMGVIDSR